MIKLISQFDNEKSKPSLATPTCGCAGCCCCCCCLFSTIVAASISARNFGYLVEKKLPGESIKMKTARKFGFWQPIGLFVIIATYFISIIQNSRSSDNYDIIQIFLFGIGYIVISTILFAKYINVKGITLMVAGFTLLLICSIIVEVFIAVFITFRTDIISVVGYLVVGIVFDIKCIVWAFGKH